MFQESVSVLVEILANGTSSDVVALGLYELEGCVL